MCEQIPSYPIYGFRVSAKGIRYGVNTESATEPSQLLLLLLLFLFLSTVEPLHNGHLRNRRKWPFSCRRADVNKGSRRRLHAGNRYGKSLGVL